MLGVVDPRPDSSQLVMGVVEEWAGSDDMVMCLKHGGVVCGR